MNSPKKVVLTDEQFDRLLVNGLRELRKEHEANPTPCPDSETLVSYVMGELDQERIGSINLHIVYCDKCYGDFLALLGPEKAARMFKGEKVIPLKNPLV